MPNRPTYGAWRSVHLGCHLILLTR
jgi:hypothetical protein